MAVFWKKPGFFSLNKPAPLPDALVGRWANSVDYVVLDCEMTGLDPRQHQIISIGAVKVIDGVVDLRTAFYRTIRPGGFHMSKENVLIHRLSHDQVDSGAAPDVVMQEFLDYIGDALLVGHFVSIDLEFLGVLAANMGMSFLARPALDTRYIHEWYLDRLVRQEVREAFELQLGNICRRLKVPGFTEHHAFGDALSTACLFIKQLGILAEEGRYTLGDVYTIGRTAFSS